MAVKIFGSALFVLCAFFWGMQKIRDMKKKIAELEAFLEFILFVGDNIEHFLKPLPDIISEYRGEYLTKCGFISAASKHGLYEAWKGFAASVGGEAGVILENYFSAVGTGYAEEEKRLSDYTVSRLSAVLEAERASVKDREKIYRTVPVMLAASVVLIIF